MMTSPVVTIGPDASVREAARTMLGAGIKRMPVVEGGRLVGMLSRHDVLDIFDRPDEELREAVEGFLHRNLFVRPDADVSVSVKDGIVTLEGAVRLEADVSVVEHLVASFDGVVAVENRLGFREYRPGVYA